MDQNLRILNRVIEQQKAVDRPVTLAPPATELAQQLDLSLSEQGADWSALEQAVEAYVKYNPDVAQPEFYKLLYSGQNQAALLGDWVTAYSNATMHTYQVGPVATLMELELIKQWNTLVGFDQGDGVMVAGGSQANLIAMMLARHRACPDFKQKGADGRHLVAYVSDQAHYSAQRAANLLGIGTDNLIAVASDDEGRLCPDALQQAIEQSLAQGDLPFYICLTAGTTVVGAFDPVEPCSEIARKYGLWLHIDGAWGGPILFSEQHKHLLANSHLADSFAWDAHKLMNVPITAAVILVKEAGLLRDCCAGGGGEYLFHADENAEFNLGERSIQCGRRADALKVWLSWKAMGNQGFAAKIDQLQQLKARFVHQLSETEGFEALAPTAYLNVLFRYHPDHISDEQQLRQLNIDICKTMMREGGPYVDYAQYKGRSGIRLILANTELNPTHLEHLLAECQRIGQQLASG